MIDLTTSYLGMTLKSPLVPSASPLSEDLNNLKRMEESGAGAVVLPSLFEEQILMERNELQYHLTHATNSFPEALSFFPAVSEFRLGPDDYVDLIRRAKETLSIPVIASLNGESLGGWTDYARRIERAGADALELNIYFLPTDPAVASEKIEARYLDIVRSVRHAVKMPIAVKLSPYFSGMASMAKRLDASGAQALVLFNRFYQPDIDLDTLEVVPNVLLSTPQALRLPLTWIGILYGRLQADLAATGGIYHAADALKALMAGARITMVCSALIRYGIGHIKEMEHALRAWMQEHDYKSVRQMIGCLSQKHAPDPAAFERAQYIRAITSMPK